MNDKEIVEQFERTWFYTRSLTNDFLDTIPDDKWNYTHHPKFSVLSKQFRHVASVYGVYIAGFKNSSADFTKKHSHYTGALSKADIKADLLKKDEKLKIVLNELKTSDLSQFRLNFFGNHLSFTEYTHILIQHECMHIGIWSNAAAFGEFPLPQSWKDEWGFK
jgi:hypothetical protein